MQKLSTVAAALALTVSLPGVAAAKPAVHQARHRDPIAHIAITGQSTASGHLAHHHVGRRSGPR